MYRTLSLTVMSVLLSAFLVAPSVQADTLPPEEPEPGDAYSCKCTTPGGLITVGSFCLVRTDSAMRAFERSTCDKECSFTYSIQAHGVVVPCNSNKETCALCSG